MPNTIAVIGHSAHCVHKRHGRTQGTDGIERPRYADRMMIIAVIDDDCIAHFMLDHLGLPPRAHRGVQMRCEECSATT